ncbi:hypothetical protein ABKN59_011813 [Abortiporus biennis]
MSDEATEIIDFSWSKFFTTASTVSIASVAVYDYLLTFDQENQHIWRRRFNLSSTVFVVNRYTIIFSILGNVAFGFISGTHSRSVVALYDCLWFSISVSATVSEIASLIFFVVRIWAIWGQHFLPLLILTPLAICLIVINAVLNFPVTYAGIIHLQYPYGGCVILPTLSDNVSNRYEQRHLTEKSSHNLLLNRLQDTGSALGILFSSLLLCATLMKTLALKRVADRAGLKGSLISLLIRDGTTYLCLTIILNIIQAIISQSNVESKAPGVLALGGLVVRLRPIIVSHMILDLKSIDQISMASLPEHGCKRNDYSSLCEADHRRPVEYWVTRRRIWGFDRREDTYSSICSMSRLPQILELAVLITATSVIHTMFPIFRCQDRRAVFIFIQLPFKYEFYFSD